MTNSEVYLSLLYATADMYCREVDKLATEKEADRAYPLCCLHLGPKLERVAVATRKLLRGKLIFEVGVDPAITAKCSRVTKLLEESAFPLLERMSAVAAPYRHLGDKAYGAVLENKSDCKSFRVVMKVEYQKFLSSRDEIRRLMKDLEEMDASLGSLKRNQRWSPDKMLS